MNDGRKIPTIDELISLPEASDARISPDGRFVAYTLTKPDFDENEYLSQIWLVANEEKATPRQLTFAKQSSHSPRWSPDGQWLAFISKRAGDDEAQIYRLALEGGESERLTELKTGPSQLDWSPGGAGIAFIAADPESEAEEERKKKYGDYTVENEDYRYHHLWLLELDGKKCRKMTGGKQFHVHSFEWSPDSTRIVFTAAPTPDMDTFDRSRIYTVDCATLAVQSLTPEYCESPRWSADGTRIAFTRTRQPSYYANNDLCVIAAEGGEIQPIAADFDEILLLQEWGPDGFYFTAVQGTEFHLFRMSESGQVQQMTPAQDEGWVSMRATFTADFKQAAVISQSAGRYLEVTTLNLADGSVRYLTAYTTETAGWQLPQPEVFRWTSADGTALEGTLTKPIDFDPAQKYPLLVVIHGGPAWVSLRAMLPTYDRRLYPLPLWLAKGAVILQPNYRGSAGYGEAFRRLNVRNLGLGDYDDVISGVDALVAEGYVDAGRVGAMGWSQGGYISMFISTYSDRFQAVSAGAGIANWMTYYVNTDVHPFTRQYLEATPWEDQEIYAQTSPMTYIQQAQTPTLIQHGKADARVPAPNAFELYQGLLDVGVEARLVSYEGMPHGPKKPGQSRQIMEDNLAWFNRWIWGEEADTGQKRPYYIALASNAQAQETGEMPAIRRYTSRAVQDIFHEARRDGAEFRILSGRHGLLAPEELVNPDAEPIVTAPAVSELAVRIAGQLQDQPVSKVVLYSEDLKENPAAQSALGCLYVAAAIHGDLTVTHVARDQ